MTMKISKLYASETLELVIALKKLFYGTPDIITLAQGDYCFFVC